MKSFRVSDRVQEKQVGPCQLQLLPVTVPQVVRWHGSIATNPNLAEGEGVVQAVVASLLDKGTRKQDRFQLSDRLERRGARISVVSPGLRVEFSGRALSGDVPEVMALMAEIIREPLLDETEFNKVKGRIQASMQQARESTSMQAQSALCRRLFAPGHPSYTPTIEDILDELETLSIETVRAYYERHFGANDLVLVMAGDLDMAMSEEAVTAAFADWHQHKVQPTHLTVASPKEPGIEQIHMNEKPALDVRLGHALPIKRTGPHWLPLHVGVFALGGNFSARLMKRVREEMGLTYGINARLSGMDGLTEGYFSTGMTLSIENLERGIEATLAVIREFIEEGCSSYEFEETKSTVAGSYQVGLSTTSALAARLHWGKAHGFPLHIIDTFADDILQLSLDDVREAVSRWLQPGQLHTTIAGTLGG